MYLSPMDEILTMVENLTEDNELRHKNILLLIIPLERHGADARLYPTYLGPDT